MPTIYLKGHLYDEIIRRRIKPTEFVNRVVEVALMTGKVESKKKKK